jgi:hypothetical protein
VIGSTASFEWSSVVLTCPHLGPLWTVLLTATDEHGAVVAERPQRRQVEMVVVGMRDQDRVEVAQLPDHRHRRAPPDVRNPLRSADR